MAGSFSPFSRLPNNGIYHPNASISARLQFLLKGIQPPGNF
jgi:hypothetical protein